MDENQMDENRIGQKQDWTKSFGPKLVGWKGVGRKLGARMKLLLSKQTKCVYELKIQYKKYENGRLL